MHNLKTFLCIYIHKLRSLCGVTSPVARVVVGGAQNLTGGPGDKTVHTKRRKVGGPGVSPPENFSISRLPYMCFSVFWKVVNYYLNVIFFKDFHIFQIFIFHIF